jgi:hypothetical protein
MERPRLVKRGHVRIAGSLAVQQLVKFDHQSSWHHQLRKLVSHFRLSKRRLAVVGLPLFCLLLVWGGLSVFARQFKLSDQFISINTSNQVLAQDIARAADSYTVKINYPNGQHKSFSLNQVGISVNLNNTIDTIHRQANSLSKRLEWWQTVPIKLSFTTNSQDFNSFISNDTSVVVAPVQNANLAINNGVAELTDATAGKEYRASDAGPLIIASASILKPVDLNLQLVNVEPTLTSAELAGPESMLNQVLQQTIVVSIGSQNVNVPADQIASWIDISPDPTSKTVNISVDSSKIQTYLNGLASSYTQPAKDQVNSQNSDGSVSLLEPGVNGVAVSVPAEALSSLTQNLLTGKGMSVSLTSAVAPYGTIMAQSWPKWIEVDITTKRLYAYQGAQLVNTFLVTAGKPSTPTPTGEFQIWDKSPLQTMVGPGYVQPNVPWINYFDHSGDAIHGNYWRPASYFGNINSSHGCVGLMDNDAEWVYNWAPIGTPVIIHT